MTKAPAQEDLDLQAAKAAEAAQAAKDEARAAEAKAAAAKKQREDEETAARTALEELRRDTFDETYNQPVREKRAAFKQSVAEGGNTVGAWVEYMAAAHTAATAERSHLAHLYRVAKDQHDAVNKQVNEWLHELDHMRQKEHPGTPYVEGNPPSGWWTPTIEALTSGAKAPGAKPTGKPAGAKPAPTKPTTRVQQINAEVNRLVEALGRDFRRSPDDDSWFGPWEVSEGPREPSYRAGEVERWERRTYSQALQDTITELVEARAKDYGTEVTARLQAKL